MLKIEKFRDAIVESRKLTVTQPWYRPYSPFRHGRMYGIPRLMAIFHKNIIDFNVVYTWQKKDTKTQALLTIQSMSIKSGIRHLLS